MTRSTTSPAQHPVAGAPGLPWHLPALLIALLAAACESPAAPASCGPLPQVTVNVRETSTVAACFNDANGDILTYTATSSNPSVATASLAGTSITVTGVAPGNTTIIVTASDPGGLQGQSSFAVMVPNRAPQPRGTMPNVTVRVGSTATVDASQYFTEPDGQGLTYTATSSDGEVASARVAGSTITVAAEAKGSATITVTASDPGGLSATQSFRLTVPNRPPAPVGGIGAQTIEVGQSVTLDVAASFTDPDGDALTYSAASSNAAVARTSVAGSAVTITAAGPGTAVITITARDDDQATATQQVSVTVPQPNRAPRPVGTIPPQTITAGGRTTVSASTYFSDPDGDALTFSASSSNSNVARASVSGSTVTITAASSGSASITVTARDPEGLSATQRFSVTVESAGAPDLEFTTVTPTSATASPGDTVRARFTIRNRGNATAAGITIRIYVSSNSTIATSDSEVGRFTIPGLPAGRSEILNVEIWLGSQASGTFYFGVCADAVPGESNRANNCSRSVRVTVGSSGAPDLEFTTVSPTSVTGSAGDTVRADFTLRNRGNATAASTTIRIYQSSNSTISTSDSEIGRFTARSLAAGRSVTLDAGVVLGSGASRTFYFGLCADAVSGESNTANNCSRGVRVRVVGSGAPDLEFRGISPTTVVVTSGRSFQLRTTLVNTGDARAAATEIRLFLSTNSTISTSDRQLGDPDDIPSLAASDELAITYTVTLTGSGSGYLGFCVDAVAGESDTTNNCSPSARLTLLSSSNQSAGDAARSISPLAKEAVLRIKPGTEPEVGLILRVKPGTEPEGANRGLAIGATIHSRKGKEP